MEVLARWFEAYGLYVLLLLAVLWLSVRRWQGLGERRAARDAIDQGRTLLRYALWGSQAELWDADLRNGRIERHEPLPHLAVSQEAQALSAASMARWVHGDDLLRFRESLVAHVKGETPDFECSYRTLDRDGNWRWMLSRGRVLERDEAQRATRMIGTTFDIEDLRSSQEAMRESEERLKLALWGSGDELWDIDLANGAIQRENALAITALGAELSFPHLDDYLAFVHPDDKERLHTALLGAIRGQEPSFVCTYRIRGQDTEWVWILGKGRVVTRDEQGKALRMLGTNRDVTSLKLAEQALRVLNDELEARVAARTQALEQANNELKSTLERLQMAQTQLVEAEKMAALGGLVAGVAHEINTPLGVGLTAASHLQVESRGLRQALDGGSLGKQQLAAYVSTVEQSAAMVMRNIERADQLVRSFKQVAVDQSSEQRRVIALDAYLAEVLQSLKPQVKRTSMELSVECPAELMLDTYPGAIYQIVVNMVMNALQHAYGERSGGVLRIVASVNGELLHLHFVDHGEGMDEEVRRRVFEPFFTTRRGQGGSGLGLHIVYNLATRLLGGKVSCHSERGAGTRFEFELPLSAPTPPLDTDRTP